ncbi:MAG: class I SAM-dependent methyltransferase [Rhodocyclaceae bacterium]|nr:class I SAM-dependent methyltransferase [Rhodocyclaceae bacterium]
MSLRHSYTLIAPFYDAFLDLATRAPRARSLGQLGDLGAGRVLLLGIGTGLDLPHLPARHHYVGLDLTPAMLARARRRARPGRTDLVQGDAMRLPFADAAFDAVVLHLILAVVPHPERCLAEAARVLRPGGVALVFDKFLRPGQSGGWRRLVNPMVRRVATRLDVVFEEVLRAAPALTVRRDEPALAGGWFRLIRLERK